MKIVNEHIDFVRGAGDDAYKSMNIGINRKRSIAGLTPENLFTMFEKIRAMDKKDGMSAPDYYMTGYYQLQIAKVFDVTLKESKELALELYNYSRGK